MHINWLDSMDEDYATACVVTAGMALATLFVTMPFVVRELIPILETMDLAEEEAARTMGASDWQVFWNVTLPNIRYGLLYGIVLTNAVSGLQGFQAACARSMLLTLHYNFCTAIWVHNVMGHAALSQTFATCAVCFYVLVVRALCMRQALLAM